MPKPSGGGGGTTTKVRPAAATRKATRPSPRNAQPAGRPTTTSRPVGKVNIKERKDASSMLLWAVVSTIILGAGAFVAWKFNLLG